MVVPKVQRTLPPEINGDRITLVLPVPGHHTIDLNEAIRESLAELRPWMAWAKETPPSIEDSEESLRRMAARALLGEDFCLHIRCRETGKLLGSTGLHKPDWDVPSFEIGYWVRTSESGKGYVLEAVELLSNFAREHFGALRLVIYCDERNQKSANVARKAGFNLEGILVNECRDKFGVLRNTMVFAKTWEV